MHVDKRPKNLNLLTIHFPIPAIVSILHRISGAFLFLLIPFLLWVFAYSLTDSGFDELQYRFGFFYVKLVCWLLFIPFCFHLLAGIRHLLLDIHVGEDLVLGRKMAMFTLIVTAIVVALAGICLW